MYLYFGKDGKLKTKINHDAPPRQGGDLNVTVCLDMDFWDDKEKWGVDGDKYWVKTARIISASNVIGYPQIATEGQIEIFSKLYNSEIVYDLVPGSSYLTYKFRFSAEEVTKIPGQINFDLSMQNMSFSDNKYVRIGTVSEFEMVGILGNGENCISRELDNLTGKISDVVYKKGNGTDTFSNLSPVSGDKYTVGTYQERIEKSGTATEGFVFVQQDNDSDGYTYGEVSIWMWAKATGADETLGWIQLPQYSPTYQIPEDGKVAFGVTDITIERTAGYARALIDKEIGIRYQDIMDEFKRVYSKIAIAGTKPDWNVGENTSPSYIYNKPNVKTVLVGDIGAIRETGVYIVKNSTIAPFPIPGDYVLFHYSDSQDNHIQLIFENQNITWFRALSKGDKDFDPWRSREIREVLKASGAPGSSTSGIVGQFYFDSSSKFLYYCVSAINGVYEWERLVNLKYFDLQKALIIHKIETAVKEEDEKIQKQIENIIKSINDLSSDITSELNKKFDKAGGEISGDVNVKGLLSSDENISTKKDISAEGSITAIRDLHVGNDAEINGNAIIRGSLTVQGEVTSVETKNVSIKDQLFEIAKGEKGDFGLASPAGFYVANYDGKGNNLAIVFDKTGTSYVGDVTIGENGLISDTSNLQPFATRQKTDIKDKSILQWDKQSNSLKDSGKTIEDFVEKQENNTGYNCLYGQDINNNVKLVRMSQNKDKNTVPLRTERGTLKGEQAEENDEFVTLQQLDNSESKLFEHVDFLEDKINETIAVNPEKTYILIIGNSVTFTVRNNDEYSVDMGDGTIYANIANVTKTHNYIREGSAHIITVSGVGTNGDFGFALGEDQNLACRSIHFGEGIKKITNFLISTPVDVCILPKTITDVLSDNFTNGNATLKYAKSVYCLSETPFTISKNVFSNSLRIFVKRDSLDQYKQAWYQYMPASIIVSEVDSSDLGNWSDMSELLMSHINDKNNPHQVTKEQVGCTNGDNTEVQSDYNQNDSTAADYIKNRPFYEGPAVVFDENIKTSELEEGTGLYVWETTNKTVNVNVGAEIEVIFDGVDYTQTVKDFEGAGTCVGNGGIVDGSLEDTKEPFFILLDIAFLSSSAAGEHLKGITVATQAAYNGKVKIIANDIKTIDPKFIKDMYYETTTETQLFNGSMDINKGLSGNYKGTITPPIDLGAQGDKLEVVINNEKTYLDVNILGDIQQAGNVDKYGVVIVTQKTGSDTKETTITTKQSYTGAQLSIKNLHTSIKQIPPKYISEAGFTMTIEIAQSDYTDSGISSAIKNYLTNNSDALEKIKTVNSFDLVLSVDGTIFGFRFVDNFDFVTESLMRSFVCLFYGQENFFNGHVYLYEKTLVISYQDTIEVEFKSGVVYDSNIKFGVAPLNNPFDTPYDFGGKLGFFTLDSDQSDTYMTDGNIVSLSEWITLAQQRADFAIPTPTKDTDLVDKKYADSLKGGSGFDSLVSVDLTYGASTVTYDTTDGMTISSTARFVSDSGDKDVPLDIEIPIVAGEGISIDKAADKEQIIIKALLKIIQGDYISITDTANNEKLISLADGYQPVQKNSLGSYLIPPTNIDNLKDSLFWGSGYNFGSSNIEYNVFIGKTINANKAQYAVTIGNSTGANLCCVSIGYNAVSGVNSTSIGCGSMTVNSSIAIGANAKGKKSYSVVIGQESSSNNDESILIGYQGNVDSELKGVIAIGYKPTLKVTNKSTILLFAGVNQNNGSLPYFKIDFSNSDSTPTTKTDSVFTPYIWKGGAWKKLIAEDDVKTLFGNQSIVGAGNIDLYRHNLNFSDKIYFSPITSSAVPIDSLTDLSTQFPDDVWQPCSGFDQEKCVIAINCSQMKYRLSDGTEVLLATLNPPTDTVTTV